MIALSGGSVGGRGASCAEAPVWALGIGAAGEGAGPTAWTESEPRLVCSFLPHERRSEERKTSSDYRGIRQVRDILFGMGTYQVVPSRTLRTYLPIYSFDSVERGQPHRMLEKLA